MSSLPSVDGNGYGLRVPGLVISAYARHGFIDHQTLSFDAYAKFIEDDFLRRPAAGSEVGRAARSASDRPRAREGPRQSRQGLQLPSEAKAAAAPEAALSVSIVARASAGSTGPIARPDPRQSKASGSC